MTDGGVGGTLISAFSFNVGPITLNPGQSAYQTIDTWYPKGSSVWDKFNQGWDLTIEFTYVANGGIRVSDSRVTRSRRCRPRELRSRRRQA
jgi:hypothetical protein